MIKAVEALVAGFSEPDVSRTEQGSFRELLEALPAAVYTTDATGTITFCNRAAIDMAGRTPIIGLDQWCVTFRLYHPDGTPLPHEQCPMAIALKERRPVRDVEIMAERPDGQLVPVMPFPTPLFDRSGKMVGAVNVLVNISKLKAAEQAEARRADEQAALYQFTDRLYRASQRAGCGGRRAGCNRRRAVGQAGLDPSVRRSWYRALRRLARFVGRLSCRGRRPLPLEARRAECAADFVADIDLADQPEQIKRWCALRAFAALPSFRSPPAAASSASS